MYLRLQIKGIKDEIDGMLRTGVERVLLEPDLHWCRHQVSHTAASVYPAQPMIPCLCQVQGSINISEKEKEKNKQMYESLLERQKKNSDR